MGQKNMKDAVSLLGALLFGMVLWFYVAMAHDSLNDGYRMTHGGQERPHTDIPSLKTKVIFGPVVVAGLGVLVARSRRRTPDILS